MFSSTVKNPHEKKKLNWTKPKKKKTLGNTCFFKDKLKISWEVEKKTKKTFKDEKKKVKKEGKPLANSGEPFKPRLIPQSHKPLNSTPKLN